MLSFWVTLFPSQVEWDRVTKELVQAEKEKMAEAKRDADLKIKRIQEQVIWTERCRIEPLELRDAVLKLKREPLSPKKAKQQHEPSARGFEDGRRTEWRRSMLHI